MKLLFNPVALARVAGLPINLLERLRLKEFFKASDAIVSLKEALANSKDEFIKILYEEIKKRSKQEEQQFLLNIKRNIFNERPIDCNTLMIKFPSMMEYAEKIEHYKRKLIQIKDTQESIYKTETLLALKFLLEVFNQNLFNCSLTIANIHFKAKFIRILSKDNFQLNDKTHRHALQTLIAYLFRATCRTTPFSGFSTTSFFNIDLFHDKKEHAKIGVEKVEIQPNRSLFKEVIKALINSKFFIENVYIFVDEFIFLDGETWYFTSSDFEESKRIGGIRNTDLLKYFIELLMGQSSVDNPILAKEFLSRINETEISSKETIQSLLLELIEKGLVKFKVSALVDSPDWLDIFLTELGKYESEELCFQIAYKLGQKTKNISEHFFKADEESRDTILQELENAWSIVTKILDDNTSKKGKNQNSILYEDRYTPIDFPLKNEYSSALCSLTHWIAKTGHLSLHKIENAAMRHFFDYVYQEQNVKIPFTTFFKDYYVNFLERGIIKSTNNKQLLEFQFHQFEYNERIQELRNLLHENISKKISETETSIKEICIPTQTLDLAQRRHPHESTTHYSIAAFVQPTNDKRIVLPDGRFHMGFGKYLSRFFNLVSQEKISDKFVPKHDEYIFGEIRGGVWFNGNLSQPMLDTIIPISGTFQDNSNKKVLLPKDFYVVRDGDHGLILLDKISNKKIVPLDLGTLDARQTPPVRRLLNCFSEIWSFTLNIPWIPQGIVTYRPRIIFEKDLVLERRKWLVSIESIPVPGKSGSDARYLNDLSCWFKQYNIPNQLFIKILNLNGLGSNLHFSKSEEKNDYLKFGKRSKFYDFENPFSLSEWKTFLLTPALRTKNTFLELEEFYPSAEEMIEINGNKKALELILHLKNDL